MSNFGYKITQSMTPMGGKGYPVQPPSYSNDTRDPLGKYAIYEDQETGKNNVVLNSVGAEAHSISESMLRILGDDAPGIFVDIDMSESDIKDRIRKKDDDEVFVEAVYNEIINLDINSYTTSHRHIDSSVRYSLDKETGRQLWSEGQSDVGKLIRLVSNGDSLIENFPNSAILGYWLSSKSPIQHKVARSLRSTIIGYDAVPQTAGATRLDLLGSIQSDVMMKPDSNGDLAINAKQKEKDEFKPSSYLIGAIPGSVEAIAFSCGDIKRESILSTRGLRANLSTTNETYIKVLEALSICSVLHPDSLGLYRSNCDIVPTGTNVEEIDQYGNRSQITDISELYDEKLAFVRENSGIFNDPIHTSISPFMVDIVAARAAGTYRK